MAPASVYLGGLPDTIGRKELFSHLSIYGNVNALNMQKGYAFVEFDSEADAMDLINTFSDQPFMGHNVKVQSAKQPRRNSVASNRTSPSPEAEGAHPRLAPEHARIRFPVLVTNLNTRTCWQELKDFGRMAGGTVAFCDIDKTNRHRGFLEYFTQEDADRAVQELHGRELLGNTVTLSSYGRKQLKPEHQPSAGAHSPVVERANHAGRQRSRSRSPVPARRQADPYPRSETFRMDRNYGGGDNAYGSPTRRVHFAHDERTDMDRRHRGRVHRRAEPTYAYSDEFFMSDERRAKIDEIALGWESLQSNYSAQRY